MTREEAAAAFQSIAQTPDGATVLNYLVGRFGYARRTTFSAEPGAMAFQEGQRSVLVDIGGLLDLDITPKEYENDRQPDIDLSSPAGNTWSGPFEFDTDAGGSD